MSDDTFSTTSGTTSVCTSVTGTATAAFSISASCACASGNDILLVMIVKHTLNDLQ